jgi:uncharacterized damage-inducible protein DinB
MKFVIERPRQAMDEVTLLRGWTEWNLKSLNDYFAVIMKLSPEERKKNRGASFGSILNIFLHILEDYSWWFEGIPQDKQSECKDLVGVEFSNEGLRTLVDRANRSTHALVDSLKNSDLGRTYVVTGTSGDGTPYKMTTCLADIMWHMLEEQLQHIGEINALFWQMDINPPTRSWFSSEIAHTF